MTICIKNNYQFLTILVKELIDKKKIPKDPIILDFGCGQCQLLRNLKNEFPNADLYGVDIYNDYEIFSTLNKEKDLFNIKNIKPYEEFTFPKKFDLIISNQVIEHIENLDIVYKQLNSFLSKKGKLIICFPVKEIFIEPHLKMPFVHWIKKNSKIQTFYIVFCNFFNINNLVKFGLNKKKYLKKIKSNINFCNKKIYYLSIRNHINLIKKYYAYPQNISDKVTFYFRRNAKFSNIIKRLIKSIPSRSIRLFISSRLIGSIFLTNKK